MSEKKTIDKSEACLNLVEELPVVGSSTTSRMLLNNELFRVVQFTFDEGQLLTEHTSTRAVVCQLVEGQMKFTISGEDHLMKAGDVIYLAPNEPHALVAETRCRLTLVLIDPNNQKD